MHKFYRCLSLLLVMCLFLSVFSSAFADDEVLQEENTGQPTEPVPKPAPEFKLEPEPIPEPVVELIPEPLLDPVTEFVQEPATEPTPEPVPESTSEPTTEQEQSQPADPGSETSNKEENYALNNESGISGDYIEGRETGHAIFDSGLLDTREVPIEMLPVYNPAWRMYENTDEPCSRLIKIAMAELDKADSMEQPKGSGLVKYNFWYYGDSASLYDPNLSWDTIFISWCAEQAGLTEDGCFTKLSNAATMYDYMREVTLCANDYLESALKGYTNVEAGDLVFLRNENGDINRAGIVTNVENPEEIKVIFGDYNGEVRQILFNASMFHEKSPFKFAEILHVEYKKNSRRVYEFCIKNLGLNKAATIGIMANISCESAFAPVCTGDNGTSFGICQWHGERWINLKNFCDSSGYVWYELEGQLAFLQYELNGKGIDVYSYLLGVTDDITGCYDAAKHFCLKFENPANAESESEFRAKLATDSFWDAY